MNSRIITIKHYFKKSHQKIMTSITLTNFDGSICTIQISEILTIIEESSLIIIVYKNGAYDRFPSLNSNLGAIAQVKLKNKPR